MNRDTGEVIKLLIFIALLLLISFGLDALRRRDDKIQELTARVQELEERTK